MKKYISHPRVKAIAKEFQEFIDRGSVIDLAIGVILGGAFSAIVKSLVDDIIMPMIGILLGGVNLTELAIHVPNIFGGHTSAHLAYGKFIQSVVQFFVVAFSLFLFMRMINRWRAKDTNPQADPEKSKTSSDSVALKAKTQKKTDQASATVEDPKVKEQTALLQRIIRERI